MEQQVTEDAIASLAVNQTNPMLMANHLAKPHDFIHAVLHVSGEALLLLG